MSEKEPEIRYADTPWRPGTLVVQKESIEPWAKRPRGVLIATVDYDYSEESETEWWVAWQHGDDVGDTWSYAPSVTSEPQEDLAPFAVIDGTPDATAWGGGKVSIGELKKLLEPPEIGDKFTIDATVHDSDWPSMPFLEELKTERWFDKTAGCWVTMDVKK